jgi:uncharacterized membrane protein
MENKDLGKTSLGMDPKLEAFLSYLAWFITGILFYILEKENKFVRFHAMQSIVAFGFFFVLSSFLAFVPFLALPVGLAELVLWVILMVKAYNGEHFKLPVAGDIAEKNS